MFDTAAHGSQPLATFSILFFIALSAPKGLRRREIHYNLLLFLCTQNSSQILFTSLLNCCYLVLLFCQDNAATWQVWHVMVCLGLVTLKDHCMYVYFSQRATDKTFFSFSITLTEKWERPKLLWVLSICYLLCVKIWAKTRQREWESGA